MATLLATSQPFELTKTLFEFQRSSWDYPQDCLDLCKKVGTIALSILLSLPALFADIILLPFSLITRTCYAPPSGDDNLQRLQNAAPFPQEGRDTEQFKNALTEAFSFLPLDRKRAYKELIMNGGMPEEGDPLIDSFKWCAEVYIVHSLRNSNPQLFPASHERHRQQIDGIMRHYRSLPPIERTAVCLKCIDPEFSVNFNRDQFDFLHEIQACALDITRNPDYNREIYTPIANEVQNL
ncbi:MAG: hypothetical protein K1X28_10010 [Parachlamydiales bacterium]|nr:hypothetical protein [Parachlamydiales bacterium]